MIWFLGLIILFIFILKDVGVIWFFLMLFFLVFIDRVCSKSSRKNDYEPTSLSGYISKKYGYFRESKKERRKLTEEEKSALKLNLDEWNQKVNNLESEHWLDTVKLHLEEEHSRKEKNNDLNYSMMYYKEVRNRLLKEARGHIHDITRYCCSGGNK